MEISTVFQLVGLAFAVGVGWSTLWMKLNRLDKAVKAIVENHLVHIQAKLDSLPCDVNSERIEQLEQEN